MKKLLLSVALVSCVANAQEGIKECQLRMVPAFTNGSFSVTMYGDIMMVGGTPRDNLTFSKSQILRALSRFQCTDDHLQIKEDDYTNNRCTNVKPGDEFSKVCYVQTKLGYAFVMTDMLGAVTVVFNRYD
jgi:hypothetical protein